MELFGRRYSAQKIRCLPKALVQPISFYAANTLCTKKRLLAFLIALAFALPTAADTPPSDTIAPLKTPWVYFTAGHTTFGCHATEQGMVDAFLAFRKSAIAPCDVWQTGWHGDWFGGSFWSSTCLPYPKFGPMERFNYAYAPRLEGRFLEYAEQLRGNNCEATIYGGWGINRQLYYYCPDGYKVTYLYPQGRPVVACKRLPEKPNPLKQERNCPAAGNPINLASGNKYQRDSDYRGTGAFPLVFERHYSSDATLIATPVNTPVLGERWRHGLERSVRLTDYATLSTATVTRADGRGYFFNLADDGSWLPDPDITGRLDRLFDEQHEPTGWRYAENDEIETYDAEGKLISITNPSGLSQTLSYNAAGELVSVADPFGRTLTFGYGTSGRIATLTDPAGGVYRYSYDANHNLASVHYPDETPSDDSDNPKRLYHYEDSRFPHALTGITDENGNRFATYAYDEKGRGILSEHAGGAERVALTYNADGTTTVTDPQGTARHYTFETRQGVIKVKTIQGGPCPDCSGQTQNHSYDTNGNVASKTDFNGNATNYSYDLTRNLEINRTEAVGKPEQRTTTTQWHAEFRLPLQIDVFDRNNTHLKRTTFTYDTVGRVLTRTETDRASGESRTATHGYNALRLLASVDGPRTDVADVTGYDYDAQGNLITSTNALGHETQISAHDAHGRPLTLQDPNGLVTQLACDARGRLKSRTVDGQVTLFSYDATGNLTGILLPNGTSLTYTYDAAHRLTAIQDSAGNTITYTLDPLDNRIKEEVTDPAGVLTRTHARVYNNLTRLLKDISGEGQERSYAYDANGNRLSAIDGRGHQSTFAFDALNRLLESTDVENGVTEYSYTALDHLTQVKDPKGLETTYTTNALGDLLLLDSPDTGTTRTAYDSAGNRVSQRDAKGWRSSTTMTP